MKLWEVLIGDLGVLCCFEKIYVKIIRFISWVRTSSEDIYVSLRWLNMNQAYSKIWPQIFDFYLEVWYGSGRTHVATHNCLAVLVLIAGYLAHASRQPSTIAGDGEVSKPNRGGYIPHKLQRGRYGSFVLWKKLKIIMKIGFLFFPD